MKREELLQFCRYYKGEEDNPYENGDYKGFYWQVESMYVENALQDDKWHSEWKKQAKHYKNVATKNGLRNLMTDDSCSIDTKAIAAYLDVIHEKWMSMDESDIVLKYCYI